MLILLDHKLMHLITIDGCKLFEVIKQHFFYPKVVRQMLIKFRLLLPCILSIIATVFIFFIALFDDMHAVQEQSISHAGLI